jgi:hypothetical protein
MTTVADLAALLTSAGFTVAPPGDNTTAAPCVVLSPVRLDLQPGNRLVYHVIDICPAVAASPWLTQYPVAVDQVVGVLRALAGTQYQLAAEIPLETDTDRSTPVMLHRINVRFAGPDLCPPEQEN